MGNNNNSCCRYSQQSNENRVTNHNHEFISSTDYAKDEECELHNHRIAGVTGPPIRYNQSHIHRINVLTDTFDDHFHRVSDITGPALYLQNGKHIHLVKGETSRNDGHVHHYYFTTLIEDPTNVPEDRDC